MLRGPERHAPVGARVIARAALLSAAAIATIGLALRHPCSGSAPAPDRAVRRRTRADRGVVAGNRRGDDRLGHSEPARNQPRSRSAHARRPGRSTPWRRYAGLITSAAPADIWREGCWRYVLYTGETGDRSVEIVFAVYLRSQRSRSAPPCWTPPLTRCSPTSGLPARSRGAAAPAAAATEPAQFGDMPGPDATRPLRVAPSAGVPQPLDVGPPGAAGPSARWPGRPRPEGRCGRAGPARPAPQFVTF